MKISNFNTTTACNVPRKLSLRDPFTGELLVDDSGNTLDFYVYGSHSDASRNARKDSERKTQKGKLSDDESAEIGAEYLARLTQGWSGNIEDDSGLIDFNHKNAVKVYLSQDWIAGQVLSFSQSLGNYDPKRYEKSGSGSQSEHGSIQSRKGAKSADTD
jgi:hypothetical protein